MSRLLGTSIDIASSTLSPEGKCFSYDIRASGFGRGEGAACMIIKSLSDALACGDPVRAIIRNSGANHSGRTQGISMPSRQAQEALLSRLHHEVNLDPNETTYVEVRSPSFPKMLNETLTDIVRRATGLEPL